MDGEFKTYHFDYRGSTVALTDINGNITDTFEYDTYGKLTSRTGTSDVIFLYNGRDGVVTDGNGLIYMRARYYSPELRRFVNADILAGRIDSAVTLNRYAYANGNPVSLIDPRGLSADERGENEWLLNKSVDLYADIIFLSLPNTTVSNISKTIYEKITQLSAVDLFAIWLFGDGSDQYFGDDSHLAESFKESDAMNDIIKKHIEEYKNSGENEFSDSARISGIKEFDLWMGVRSFSYEMKITEGTYESGVLWWKKEKTEYTVDVRINDIYNFNSKTDSGDGLGSMLNNFGYMLHERGIGNDYKFVLEYQTTIR